ncbi:MAG: DUF1684 domain-containing protein [Chloroflexota bacterium]
MTTNDDPSPIHEHRHEPDTGQGHDQHAEHEHDHDHEHEHDFEPLDYTEAVEAFRAEKDHYFRHGEGSPLPPDERETFAGLAYYPVDPSLVFEGLTLEPYAGSEQRSFMIPTSDGRLRPAHRAGSLHFEIDGEPRSLAGYVLDVAVDEPHEHEHEHEHRAADDGDEPGPNLFVPFLDQTSGTETYGAGRYLDIEPDEDGTYALDFNLAYHPSCVYDDRFSCPLTPAENRLGTRIEAGERLPDDFSH